MQNYTNFDNVVKLLNVVMGRILYTSSFFLSFSFFFGNPFFFLFLFLVLCAISLFIYLWFCVALNTTDHITMGSFVGKESQYIQLEGSVL